MFRTNEYNKTFSVENKPAKSFSLLHVTQPLSWKTKKLFQLDKNAIILLQVDFFTVIIGKKYYQILGKKFLG